MKKWVANCNQARARGVHDYGMWAPGKAREHDPQDKAMLWRGSEPRETTSI